MVKLIFILVYAIWFLALYFLLTFDFCEAPTWLALLPLFLMSFVIYMVPLVTEWERKKKEGNKHE